MHAPASPTPDGYPQAGVQMTHPPSTKLRNRENAGAESVRLLSHHAHIIVRLVQGSPTPDFYKASD